MKRGVLPYLVGVMLMSTTPIFAQSLTIEEADRALKEQGVKSALSGKELPKVIQSCQAVELNCALVDESGALTALGAEFYQLLEESESEGLSPKDYHYEQLAELLAQEEGARNSQEIEALLLNGMLTYIRDMGQGRPHLKRLDRDWLLDGRTVDPVARLLEAIERNSVEPIKALAPDYPEYRNLKKALQNYKNRLNDLDGEAKIAEGRALRKGDRGERVQALAIRLMELGYLSNEKSENEDDGELVLASISEEKSTLSDYFDDRLFDAVKRFQREHLLEPDGIVGRQTINEINMSLDDRIDQIKINMERWRWMPQELGDHYLVVDVPKYEYTVIKDGVEKLRAKTIVGMNRRKTPVFSSDMSYIVFSPYWHVPRSMAVRDQLPKLRQDPYRLERSNIRIYDRAGNEVDPGMIDWHQYTEHNFPFTLRQDPGRNNALGQVKFMFPNDYAIYLHDTPNQSLFNKTARTFSSGCIRIENPTELAMYLLDDLGWTQERIEKAYGRKHEVTVRLSDEMKFPVYTLYMTVDADENGEAHFRPDIYDKDAILIKEIKK